MRLMPLWRTLSVALIALTVSWSSTVYALPISWSGFFGVDSIMIDNYKRTKSEVTSPGNHSQLIPDSSGAHQDASFQSYLMRLQPTLIVNDSATLKGEITTGYARGGRLGDSSANRGPTNAGAANRSFGNALYLQNYSNGTANVLFSQFYAELYADTATFVLGRQPHNWGLGAVYDSGEDAWDRYTTTKDGLQAKFKLGNFHITPFYFKIDSLGSLTKATNSKEIGISLLYDSPERELAFGILYARKKNNPDNPALLSGVNTSGGTTRLAAASVKITDIFLKKTWHNFTFSAEVPILTGEAGHVFADNLTTKYKSLGIITESKLKINDTWSVGVNAGLLSGEDGNTSSFDAMFLNPNYQIANLLFRYNLMSGVGNAAQAFNNIFDSYMVNTEYLNLWAEFRSESWKWKLGVVMAKAEETVEECSANCGRVYNHANNTFTTSATTKAQSDDYGLEIDLNFDYYWNENIVIGGGGGYHFVGDYFAYNGANDPIPLEDSYVAFLRAGINF